MALLTSERLRDVVHGLMDQGVRFPERYPPANLPSGGPSFRGVWAEVETAALLARVVDPELLELAPRDEAGDTDIIVHLSPPYRLQVKGPIPAHVSEDLAILAMVRSARREALQRFHAEQPTTWQGVFSNIRIHQGKDGETHSGISRSVDHPSPVHVAVVEIDKEVLATIAKKNLERWIREAVRQLVRYEDALLVPVLNLSRYPLDQAEAYAQVKQMFLRHPRWQDKVSGVVLVLRGYQEPDLVTGFHTSDLRLVGVENPLAPKERRLKPETFNPNVYHETVFREELVVISVDPPFVPWRIEHRLVWVENTPFGALPKPLGEPFAVVPPGNPEAVK